MQSLFIRYGAFVLATIFTLSLFAIDADAQRRRSRRVRAPRPVVTNPEIAPPGSESVGPDGEKIISTADETPAETSGKAKSPEAKKKTTEGEMEKTINALSNQIDRLNNKLSKMEEKRK